MKRRDFLKKGTTAAGLASSSNLILPAKADDTAQHKPSGDSGQAVPPPRIHSADFLRREQAAGNLPKRPVIRKTRGAAGVEISPMPLKERLRRGIVPRRGFCSIAPAGNALLISGNGHMNVEVLGDPRSEQILFRHEGILTPIKQPYQAPDIADIFPQVRKWVLDGKYHEAAELGYRTWHERGAPAGRFALPAFTMNLDSPSTSPVKDYLRTLDFESTELRVHWTDERGEWLRQLFCSRPDNVVVQSLTAPQGQPINVRIALQKVSFASRSRFFGGRIPEGEITRDFDEQRLVYQSILDPSVSNSGFAAVIRIVRHGGSARMEGDTLAVKNASSLMLHTRIAYFSDISDAQVEALRRSVEELPTDYAALLERARKVHAEMLNRVTVDFGGGAQHGLSSEELLSAQRSSPGYSPAYLEKLFDMCRYWFILTSGQYCSMQAETNANINLQIAPGVQGDHREGMDAYFHWMESLAPDFKANAKNIFGMRGAHYALTPNQQSGVDTHFDHADSTAETWPHPYWLSAGGWCVRPFWDQYLVSGDLEFLRNRVVPAYKDLALFYEDFLTVMDPDGNYIMAPGFSPENNPGNLDPSCMLVQNTSMDIAVCREVLSNLVEACETLNMEADGIPKWKAMMAKLPPYLLERDGTLKEYASPMLAERYVHRHISHLYGAWPGDEIDPDRTPQLAKAVVIANRHRVPERLAAHGRCHRALVGARLKDAFMVDSELRQLIEEGNVGQTLRCAHDPYAVPMPDAQGGIQLIVMEMLAYSRPGIIEVLPALPPPLLKGSINGMLLRTFARLDKLSWDMRFRTVDLTITSARKQNVTLMARQGIASISATAGVLAARPQPDVAVCELRLPQGISVDLHLRLGKRNTLDWINR